MKDSDLEEKHEESTLIPIPGDKVELVNTLLSSMEEGNRMVLDKLKKDITQITNNRRYIKNLDNPYHVPVPYMKEQEVDTAYKYALDATNPTPADCFNQVVVEHGVTKEYVDKAKDTPTFHTKTVVDANIEHPVVAKMSRNKVLDIKSLKKSSTPNQLISSITNRRSVSDRLDQLEMSVEQLQSQVTDLEVKQASTEMDVESIFSMVESGTSNHKERQKEKARLLKSQGYTHKEISKALGVEARTVRRWLTELQSIPK